MVAADDAKQYAAEYILPTLQKGLAALCKARPSDPTTFLAEWLLANKPAPPTVSITDAFRDAVVQVFHLADEDGSGQLEFEEVRVIATGNREAEAILMHLDMDGNGAISEEEWLSFFSGLFERNQQAAEGLLERSVHLIFERDFLLLVRALFEEFDRDGSGTLELQEILLMLGDDDQGAEFLAYADGNGDMILNLSEWMNYFYGFWRYHPGMARANVGYLMQRAAELQTMPQGPPMSKEAEDEAATRVQSVIRGKNAREEKAKKEAEKAASKM